MKFNKNEFGWKEKVSVNTDELPDDISIKNSLTVGSRIGDIGCFSVSEGDGNTASGTSSHAEGEGVTAEGYCSHAEGYNTTASGDWSHAEGRSTTASGSTSHVEGISATASGTSSHAEGEGATASGNISHAEGDWTVASGDWSHAEGGYTTASGDYSHAEGGSTIASGSNSHAEGESTTASGGFSHAEGNITTALGNSSHIEGKSSNLASDKIIDLSSSTDNNSIITKWETSKFSLAKGEASHVEGMDNLALGKYSHAEGVNTTASSLYSHAEGENTTALGVVSHTEGSYTTASGEVSHAEGSNTEASGDFSHAEGNYAIASGYISHAEGISSTASGNYSHAEGGSTNASGDYSHAEGGSTNASGESSHAEGKGTKASSGNQHVQGKYNIEDTANTYAHIVGNGTSDGARSNAHTLDWQGNGWYKGKLSQDGTPTEDKDLTTKKYVDDKVAGVNASTITGLATVATSGSYNDLTNKPIIPSIEGLATETYVNNKLSSMPKSLAGHSGAQVLSYIDKHNILERENMIDKAFQVFTSLFYSTSIPASGDISNLSVNVVDFVNTIMNACTEFGEDIFLYFDFIFDSPIKFVVMPYSSSNMFSMIIDDGRTRVGLQIEFTGDGTGEYTKTSTELVTKKYVDDAIANQPTFSFNDSGELVVTINGVSKTFVPKQ